MHVHLFIPENLRAGSVKGLKGCVVLWKKRTKRKTKQKHAHGFVKYLMAKFSMQSEQQDIGQSALVMRNTQPKTNMQKTPDAFFHILKTPGTEIKVKAA